MANARSRKPEDETSPETPQEDSPESEFVYEKPETQVVNHVHLDEKPGSEEVVTDTVANQPNLNEAGKQPLSFQDFLEYQKSLNQGVEAPKRPHPIQECWNCHEETLGEFAGDHDVCSNCGFDRSKIFNLLLLER